VWRKQDGFPLLDKLRLAIPMQSKPSYSEFSGIQVGVDTDKLAYYALSVIWRSGIHQWQTIGNQTTSVVLAQEEKERIRRYLLGEIALPKNIGVMVHVCTDLASQYPVLASGMPVYHQSCLIYALLVRGINFNVMISAAQNSQFIDVCCVRSPAKRIFLSDRSQITLNEMRHFYEESKLARNVRLKL
jgi:hypothetical protein